MQRRSFLGAMLAACAGPAIVKSGVLMPVRSLILPEVEIVSPAQFFAEMRRSKSLLTAADITREALRILNDNLNFAASINREWQAGPGSGIVIRKPQRYQTGFA